MPKLPSLLFLIATLVAPSSRNPGNPAAEAFRKVAGGHSKAMLAAAKLMPADKYGYRPTPAQRSFGETIAHIVSDSHITCSAIAGVGAGPEQTLSGSDSKEKLVSALQSTLDFCDSALAGVTDAKLDDSVTYYGDPGVRVQALIGLIDDWSDHYSQQAIYLRLNGILPPTAKPKSSTAAATSDSAAITHDGQRDFDFELGTWAIDMKRLQHPLSGSTTWTHPAGYSHIVQKVWSGQASLAQLANDRPSPHFDGLMLRMYDPKLHEWRIYWGSSKTGTLDEPLIGHFTNGRGEFVMHDTYEGKPILARVVYSDITPTSFRTESSFSADNGTSWEPNLVQTFTRVKR
jgi:hypothetical protein